MSKKIDIGAACEHMFAAELLKRGIMPSWPSSQMMPYDLVAELPEKIARFQVKGTQKKTTPINFQVMKEGLRSSKIRYEESDFDYLAVYTFAHGLWYIIPVKDFGLTTLTIKPGNPRCKWHKYVEAWHLLS